MDFVHIPVLLHEVLEGLAIRPDGIYVDGTVGGAGHSTEIAKRLTAGGKLIGFDRDPDAVEVATQRLAPYPATVVHHNYDEMAEVLTEMGEVPVDGVLLDLGVSSHQLDEESRGFSYHHDAPLDMRMSQTGMTAEDLVNTASEEELSRILYTYGEESFARSIARNIVRARAEQPIHTTLELAELIKSGVPQKVRRMKNPCKKSFQAIRIAVNGEFEHLENGLKAAFSVLKPGGRLAVITFHSLEDRIVKKFFEAAANPASGINPRLPLLPSQLPQPLFNRAVRILPSEKECEENPRARSSVLRGASRTDAPWPEQGVRV